MATMSIHSNLELVVMVVVTISVGMSSSHSSREEEEATSYSKVISLNHFHPIDHPPSAMQAIDSRSSSLRLGLVKMAIE